MREILFRAKRLNSDKWVEGCLTTRTYADSDRVFEAHIMIDAYEQMNVLNYGTQPVLISPVTIDEFDECCFRVDINTIGQYTGMEDKNGKKVFEGDIVVLDKDVKEMFSIDDGEVRYGFGGFHVKNFGTLSSLNTIASYDCVLRGEVIGNIHDNPELLDKIGNGGYGYDYNALKSN